MIGLSGRSKQRVTAGRLALVALVAVASGCSSFHGLHSARTLRSGDYELGVELSRASTPEFIDPLDGFDPRIETNGVDASGRLGVGDGLDGMVRLGTSGLEGAVIRQLTPRDHPWLAIAVVSSARPRLLFASTGEAWRLFDFILTFPVEVNPHPRVALIAEPKGMLSLDIGCRDAGTGCTYFPFHAGVSGGGRVRLWRGLVLGLEGAWYPLPIVHQKDADPRPTSWEASVSVSWLFDSAGAARD